MGDLLHTIVLRHHDQRQRRVILQALHCTFPDQLQVLVAEGLDEVLRLVVAHNPELVITDFQVPRLAHYDPLCDENKVVRYLNRRHHPVPSIVIATEADRDFGPVCEAAGAAAFIMDPAPIEAVLNAVERTLSRVVRDESELVLSDTRGQLLFHQRSAEPVQRAELSAFLLTRSVDLAQVLGSGPMEGVSLQGDGFEVWFESRDEVLVLACCSPSPASGFPPPGPSLGEALKKLATTGQEETGP